MPEFVAFLHAQGITGPIRARLALEWACQASAHRGPGRRSPAPQYRTGFLAYLQASAPDTEVPDSRVCYRAPAAQTIPLYADTTDRALPSRKPESATQVLTAPHLSTLIGLLASTGLRVGEAIRLQGEDVKLDLGPPQLHILETKFHKSRIVPLHPSTADRLHHYAERRAHLHYDALSDTFRVGTGTAPASSRPALLVHQAVPFGHRTDPWGAQSLPDVVSAYVRGDLYAAVV